MINRVFNINMRESLFKNMITNRDMHTHAAKIHKIINSPPKINMQTPLPPQHPLLFDVSLRDGIQGANPLDYPTNKKINILKSIFQHHSPAKIEIGSFVSPKVLPIMSDTATIFQEMPAIFENKGKTAEIYVLVPNKTGLMRAIDCGFTNFSFITSVSNAFQMKNTGKNLIHKKHELQEMMRHVAKMSKPSKTKLYISCVNECPLYGVIDRDLIVHEILSSYGRSSQDYEYNEICISDTMGTLKCHDFEYIVNGLLRFGIPKTRISMHLHINSGNALEAKRILLACFRSGIYQFDVSTLSEGGCSVTMEANQLKPNMSYEFVQSAFEEYTDSISDNRFLFK